MSIPTSFRPYNALDSREVELQPIGVGDDLHSARFTGFGRRKRWRLPPWEQIMESLGSPRTQKWFWLLVAFAVIIAAGVVLASAKRQQTQLSTSGRHSSGVDASFAAEPWAAPSGRCSLAESAAATNVLGPQQQLAAPLNYHVLLQFEEAHFAVGDAAAAAVARGLQAEANITFAIQQETSCLQLAATDLTFSSIWASLLTGTALLQQSQPADVCLCGSGAGCVTDDCARLFKASTETSPGTNTWLLSLGPLVAPAGSTLLLATRHKAQFSLAGQGVVRSAAFTPEPLPDATGAAQQVMISTSLEPYGAERVFPCVEEPRNKATFAVVIEAPARFTILSNMPEASRTPASSGASRVVVEFLPSPPMSAYLLAFAVGDMQAASVHTSSGQLVRVWSPKISSWLAALGQSLALAVSALEHYTQYANVSQPLNKFDLVAVPGRTGAIESWGMLLFDPERFLVTLPSAWSLFRCADVICHEVAHQWFGNLVTTHTWGDLLVNEGLASLAEYGCMAEVLTQQWGPAGAAALMRQVVGPHGRLAGVHEGPFAKTLEYDALPTAQPLLGAITPDFGVPAYSKASAVMAMLTQYGASARLGLTDQAVLAGGPVASLVARDPAGDLQVALQQYLRSRIYGTATAQDVLQLFLALTPDDMAGSSAAVMAAWHQPGSPLIAVQHTEQGLQVSQHRFCSAGLLSATFLDQLLSKAYGSSDRIPTPAMLEPGLSASSTNGSAGDGIGRAMALSCPVMVDQAETAIPWTPVLLAMLPSSNDARNASSVDSNQPSASLQSNTSRNGRGESTNGSITGGSPATAACGSWQVINGDAQLLQLPVCISTGTAASLGDSSTLLQQQRHIVLEGDGGWGLYRTLYAAEQREEHRKWIAQQLLPLMQQLSAVPPSAESDQQPDALQLLFTAAKLLKDQASLALSPFGEVPALELLKAVQAASTIAAAAAATVVVEVNDGRSIWPGLGVVTYTLLSPLLPLVDELLDRVAVRPSCRVRVEERLASMLAPVAAAALQAYGSPSSSGSWNTTAKLAQQQYTSTDQLLGQMTLSGLLTTAGMTDPPTAQALCQQFNTAAAADVASSGDVGAQLLKQLHPDARDALLAVAAAQPTGCQLDVSGLELALMLQQLYFTAPDPATGQIAAFALAHAAGRATPDESWQEVLRVLLGLGMASNQGQAAAQTPQQQPEQQVPVAQLACGVPFSTHALELAQIVSRGATSSRVHQAARADSHVGAADGQTLGPVLQYLMQQWQQVVLVLGQQKAWQVFAEIAAQEVQTTGQWQQLVHAVLQQPSVLGAQQQLQDGEVSEQQRKQLNSLLGVTWSNVAWGAQHLDGLCGGLI